MAWLAVVAVSTTFVVVALVTPFVSTIIIVAWPVIAVIASALLITRGVFALVPVVPHKINGFATGVVLSAVPAPVLDMPRWNAQIDRWATGGDLPNVTRTLVDELRRREAADVESAIEAGLADAHRYPDIGGECRCAEGGNKSDGQQEFFHGFLSVVSNA